MDKWLCARLTLLRRRVVKAPCMAIKRTNGLVLILNKEQERYYFSYFFSASPVTNRTHQTHRFPLQIAAELASIRRGSYSKYLGDDGELHWRRPSSAYRRPPSAKLKTQFSPKVESEIYRYVENVEAEAESQSNDLSPAMKRYIIQRWVLASMFCVLDWHWLFSDATRLDS